MFLEKCAPYIPIFTKLSPLLRAQETYKNELKRKILPINASFSLFFFKRSFSKNKLFSGSWPKSAKKTIFAKKVRFVAERLVKGRGRVQYKGGKVSKS